MLCYVQTDTVDTLVMVNTLSILDQRLNTQIIATTRAEATPSNVTCARLSIDAKHEVLLDN